MMHNSNARLTLVNIGIAILVMAGVVSVASKAGILDSMVPPKTGLPTGVTGSGLTGGPATAPTNSGDAKAQGGAQLAGMAIQFAVGALSKAASDRELEKTAKEALANKPSGTVAIIERQIIESTPDTPGKDSLIDVPSFRIASVTTGANSEEAEANVTAGRMISRGQAWDEPNTVVIGSEKTAWKSAAGGEVDALGIGSAALNGKQSVRLPPSEMSYVPTWARFGNPPPSSVQSSKGIGSSGGFSANSMFAGPVTPALPRDVGITTMRGGDRGQGSRDGPAHGANWAGQDAHAGSSSSIASR